MVTFFRRETHQRILPSQNIGWCQGQGRGELQTPHLVGTKFQLPDRLILLFYIRERKQGAFPPTTEVTGINAPYFDEGEQQVLLYWHERRYVGTGVCPLRKLQSIARLSAEENDVDIFPLSLYTNNCNCHSLRYCAIVSFCFSNMEILLHT